MCRIKPFIIFPMTSLYFPVMSGGKGPNHFVMYTVLFQMDLKESGFISMGSETICELGTIVRLDTFNRHGKGLYQVFQELCYGINRE